MYRHKGEFNAYSVWSTFTAAGTWDSQRISITSSCSNFLYITYHCLTLSYVFLVFCLSSPPRVSNWRGQELCLSSLPPYCHHLAWDWGSSPMEAQRGQGMNEKSQLLLGLQNRGFRQRGWKHQVPKGRSTGGRFEESRVAGDRAGGKAKETQGGVRCGHRGQTPRGLRGQGGKLALSFNLIRSHRKVWRRVTWSDSYFSKVLPAAGAECTEGGRRGGREQLETDTVVPGRDQEGRESFPEGAVVQLIWKDG